MIGRNEIYHVLVGIGVVLMVALPVAVFILSGNPVLLVFVPVALFAIGVLLELKEQTPRIREASLEDVNWWDALDYAVGAVIGLVLIGLVLVEVVG